MSLGLYSKVPINKYLLNKGAQDTKTQQTALQKIRERREQPKETLAPLVKPEFKTPDAAPLEPVARPTLQDFLSEAQKLSLQKSQAQAQQLKEQTGDVAEEFARQLFGRNVGATSGVGRKLASRAIEEQAQRLEPLALQEAARLGEQELSFRQQEEVREQQRQEARRENVFNQVLQGTLDKSQISAQDWAELGVTDPNAVRTLQEVDFRSAMIADGLDPNNPQDITSYRQGLRDAKNNQLRQQIVSNFAAVNDGQIPSPDEVEMMMMIYGGGSGLLTPEEETAIVNKYNQEQWQRTMQKAEAMNPPEGKVLCTELHRQGLLNDEIYKADLIMGKYFSIYYPSVVYGYHRWAKPVVGMMQKSKVLTYILKPFITAWAKQMHYQVTRKGRPSLIGKFLQMVGIPLCKYLGKRRRHLYGNIISSNIRA